jgi:two-component system phosphate regulon response regulator PhoB
VTPKRLLLVEDDRALAELVSFHFDRAGYAVTRTGDGEEALILADEVKPDLVLLDWMIEGISGIEVCRRLRRRQATANVPIIMLTARGEEDDRIRGLETGADDYMTKPFSPKELVARAGAVLRRVRPALAAEALGYAGLEMDLVAHRVKRDGQALQLGPTEYRLLRHFLENPGRVYSRQQLLETVWPHSEDIELRTVDVHIRRLRLAIGEPDLIRTVRSAGYAVTRTGDGEEALILADEVKPDLVLLDWMIEGISGIEVCRRLRRRQATANVPIIMLTARGEEDDRIRGLETGADDYMTKPFSPKELVARAGAVLRRVRPALAAEALAYAGLEMDLVAHRVKRDGQAIQLGPTEYRLLRHFLENPGRVYSRQQLLETVWPHSEDIELRTVDVHIRRLRLALGEPDIIRTVRSAGYALDAEGVA